MIARKLKVKGMKCAGCETIIGDALRKVNGVESVAVNYDAQTVEIAFDPEKTNIDEIWRLVEAEGYTCDGLIAENAQLQAQPAHEKADSASEDKAHSSAAVCGELHEEVKPVGGDAVGGAKPDSGEQAGGEGLAFGTKLLGWALGLAGLLVIAYFGLGFVENVSIPEISPDMGYGLLFVVGLLTGFHCISMCGSFVVSYTAKAAQDGSKAYTQHLKYAAGKTISYTVIGAAFGLLGSIIAFTPAMRGAAGIIAGVFLVVFGLNMLNVFPWLRGVRIKTPAFLNRFVSSESKENSNRPLVIGLLNGLMIACGPLQAIYIMAAGTGSMVEGAKLLFVFALGTLPVMLGFGYVTTLISKKATHKILSFSGAVVILLGLMMFSQGLTLAGISLDAGLVAAPFSPASGTVPTGNVATVDAGVQTIEMAVNGRGFVPNTFILQKGVPVKWVIDGQKLNGCNSGIIVPKLGLDFKVKPGKQVIEFTPTEAGTIPWSCWMGMIRGSFIVKEDVTTLSNAEVQQELASAPKPGGSCGGGGGGCGCGG